jgi:hypothetical protein
MGATPEEAEIALGLGALPEPLDRFHRLARKSGISKEELEATLDRMVSKWWKKSSYSGP